VIPVGVKHMSSGKRWYSAGSLRVYLLLCLLDWSLFVFGFLLLHIELALSGPAAPCGITRMWYHVTAAPVATAYHLGARGLDGWMAANPFITGFVWWLAWRLWRLFRNRPEAIPPHPPGERGTILTAPAASPPGPPARRPS
jgi:hypothetical protein